MNHDKLSKTYKEIKLINNYFLRQSKDYYAIFKEDKPIKILESINDEVYNEIFDFQPKAKSIIIGKDKISMDFFIKTKEFKDHDLKGFYVNIGYKDYEFTKSKEYYHVDIPYNSIDIPGKSEEIYLKFTDKNGLKFKKKFISIAGLHGPQNHDVYTSKIKNYKNHSIYIYETWRGYIKLAYREINHTDDVKEQKKIKLAFLKQKIDSKLGRNKPKILIYEKFCGRYEESGKYVYQKLIDDGCEDVYFILDKNSPYYQEVPKKYRKNIINKYSFKHYYEFFNAKAFISTESFYHAIETTNSNALVRNRQKWRNYYYYFLQHGVMYGYSLKGRDNTLKNSREAFIKGVGFGHNSFIVISSEKEGRHFIEQGEYDREDLIKSGLPKFDYTSHNEDADKILIMPTTRNFEYSTIRDDTKNSTYYNFSKRIIESVPDELKDKIVFIPHPIVNKIIGKTDLEKYMPEEFSYNELLKNTRLLITDYSSISFDAFYRGCNVVFAWMEKEMCLEKMGLNLMLNDDNAFADIAYDYKRLNELISKNYYGSHSEENTRKYREIVEFYDNKNTERFIDYLYNTNLFPEKAEKASIKDSLIEGIEDHPYTGKPITYPKVKITYKGKKLIKNLDYTFKYKNNIDIGTATYVIKGKGIYSGSKSINFEIKTDIINCEFEQKKDFDFNIIDNNTKLSKNVDYIYEEVDYPNLGIKEIIIKGIGKYIGEKSILYEI